MKDAEDLHVSFGEDEVSDSVVAPEQDTDVAIWTILVPVATLVEARKRLAARVDFSNDSTSRFRAVLRYVVVDVSEPARSLFGPSCLTHEVMRRFISS